MSIESIHSTDASAPSEQHKPTLEETLNTLPEELKQYIPSSPDDMAYFSSTNEMHTDLTKPGGSKFLELANIFETLGPDAKRIAEAIRQRVDDREALIAAGADESSFLPVIISENYPLLEMSVQMLP